MRRLVNTGPGRLAVAEAPDPEARSGEMVVRVQLSLLDRAAVEAIHQPREDGLPRVVGGAAAGLVESSAGALRSGSPVIVWPQVTCRACPACRAKAADECDDRARMGVDLPGTLAERVAVKRTNIVRVPGVLGPVEAVAATDYVHAWNIVAGLPGLRRRSRVLIAGDGRLADQAAELVVLHKAIAVRESDTEDDAGISHAIAIGRPVEPLVERVMSGGAVVVASDVDTPQSKIDLDRLLRKRLAIVARGQGGPNAYRDLVAWMARVSFSPETPEVIGVDDLAARAPESPVVVLLRSGS